KGQTYIGLLNRPPRQGVASDTDPGRRYASAEMRVCFERGAEEIKVRDTTVDLQCKEGAPCAVARTEIVGPCPGQAQAPSGWIAPVFAQTAPPPSGTAAEPRHWIVPSLTTLREMTGTRQAVGYSDFLLTSGPLPDMKDVDSFGYAIRV